MGLVQFVSKFIPNLSSIAEPIKGLTRKNATFRWEEDQQVAFERLKKLLVSADTLAYFDADSTTRIVADASPVGLGALARARW